MLSILYDDTNNVTSNGLRSWVSQWVRQSVTNNWGKGWLIEMLRILEYSNRRLCVVSKISVRQMGFLYFSLSLSQCRSSQWIWISLRTSFILLCVAFILYIIGSQTSLWSGLPVTFFGWSVCLCYIFLKGGKFPSSYRSTCWFI